MTFRNFCKKFNKNLFTNQDAQDVFDYLTKPESIASFEVCTKLNISAISGIVKDLESNFANSKDFPLTEETNRRMVGKMVKFIMEFFGYSVSAKGLEESAQLRKFTKAKYFKTAAIYTQDAKPLKSIYVTII